MYRIKMNKLKAWKSSRKRKPLLSTVKTVTLSIYYHTFDKSKYELDFLIQTANDEIIPVEVKAGENLKANSFKLFCQKNNPKKAIRTSLTNYNVESWMTNLPLYAINAIDVDQ